MHDTEWMRCAIALAKRGLGDAGTNPPVGAVLVLRGEAIGEGWHRGPGTAHAEAAALDDATRRAGSPEAVRGATLYCTLEPCCHSGEGKRTPPCAPSLAEAGIARVVIACLDPNPRVSGGGVAYLKARGVEVSIGVLAEEAAPLLAFFSVSIREKRPFVTLKWAQSLDGRLACRNGASKWITNERARARAHALRAAHDAVAVGSGTLRSDDPELSVRLAPGRDPIKVIVTGGRAPDFSKRALLGGRLLVVAPRGAPALAACAERGIDAMEASPGPRGVDLPDMLGGLYRRGIGSLLVEGGPSLLRAFFSCGVWDEARAFIAPTLLGAGPGPCDLPFDSPSDGIALARARIEQGEGYFEAVATRDTGGEA
jgi:diaminohydroxyphosphoribosylaminopyrimidine deaminase/5-amino-6-(5-phosphoribosylamino)uracil reductase